MLIQVKSNKSIIIIGELEIYSHANIVFLKKKSQFYLMKIYIVHAFSSFIRDSRRRTIYLYQNKNENCQRSKSTLELQLTYQAYPLIMSMSCDHAKFSRLFQAPLKASCHS